ncbi:hypothetical protein IWW55_004081, partial [Coemansia sp. RSA 2706]
HPSSSRRARRRSDPALPPHPGQSLALSGTPKSAGTFLQSAVQPPAASSSTQRVSTSASSRLWLRRAWPVAASTGHRYPRCCGSDPDTLRQPNLGHNRAAPRRTGSHLPA